jgi:hypothetical protein
VVATDNYWGAATGAGADPAQTMCADLARQRRPSPQSRLT